MSQITLKPSDTPNRPWWWRALGLRRREGKRLRIGLTKWGWCLLLLVIFGGGMGAFAEYSMQPEKRSEQEKVRDAVDQLKPLDRLAGSLVVPRLAEQVLEG